MQAVWRLVEEACSYQIVHPPCPVQPEMNDALYSENQKLLTKAAQMHAQRKCHKRLNDLTLLIRELKQGRRQRQRRREKTMIWLVEWGKIIVLHVRHTL